MRRGLVALLLSLTASLHAHAGIYQTLDPDPYPLPADPKIYLARVDDVRTLARLQAKVDALKQQMGSAPTLEQQLNLSALYLRMGEYPRALTVLSAAEKSDPDNFMVLGNLATAYQGTGDYLRAQSKLQQALKIWPRTYPGWSPERLFWYWRVEHYQLDWIKALNRAQVRREPTDPMEGLFPGVKLFTPKQEYFVGQMSAQNRLTLPPDALDIVKQLVLWFPHDHHLYWVLGEMYNAHGDISIALKIIKELMGEQRRFSLPEMRDHRLALIDANETLQAFTPEVARGLFQLTQVTPSVDLGPVVQQMSTLPVTQPAPRGSNEPQETPGPMPTAAPRLDGWQPIVVAFFAGLVIGALIVFQIMELRRRAHVPVRNALTGRS